MPTDNNSEELQDLAEKFAPGETTAVEGSPDYGIRNERIPEKYRTILKTLCQKVGKRDMFARIEEVKRAAERRFAWRGMFDVCYNDSKDTWQQIGSGLSSNSKDDGGDVELHYPFNIFQAFGREHITIVAEPWNVRMEPVELSDPSAQRLATQADAMRRKIEAQQDGDRFRKDAARLAWTDGRTAFYSRWVTDGARFGYHDQAHSDESAEGLGGGGNPPKKRPRKPKGGELLSCYGVLEHKVPINMREQAEYDFQQLSFEISITSAKAMYPHIAKNMKGGTPGPGEFNFDRTTRIACTQGLELLTQSGDTVEELPTWQRTWFRPSFFVEIENDEDRAWFEDNYPDGAMVAFVGDTYAESRNESMDDHWQVNHPLPGDGQNTPACGEIIMPVQDAICDMTDLKMERFMKSIPAIYCDKDVISLQAISKEKAGPGAHYAAIMPQNGKMSDGFFTEPAPQVQADEPQFFTELFGPIPQFLTGLYPAAVGQSDPNNDTVRGIKMLSDASKGQSGGAWNVFRAGYAKSLEQLVRLGAYYRAAEAEDGIVKMSAANGESIDIELEDLRDGNWACKPDGDQSYPNTHSERKAAYNEFAKLAGATPAGMALLTNPKNLIIAKDLNGLYDLEIPSADEEENTLEAIKQLLEETPIPNQQAQAAYMVAVATAQAAGQPAPPQPPMEALYQPSVAIDAVYDDNAVRFQAVKEWINSGLGQNAKRENKDGFLNVRLYGMAQQKMGEQKQQASAAQQLQMLAATEKAKQAAKPTKTPSESINFKDLGSSGKIQVGAQAGLDLRADEAHELAADTMGENEKPAEKSASKPAGKVQ